MEANREIKLQFLIKKDKILVIKIMDPDPDSMNQDP
jgi:hypothetical protein